MLPDYQDKGYGTKLLGFIKDYISSKGFFEMFVLTDKGNPVGYPIGTLYEIKTSYTKEQIEKMFKKASHDNEVKELVFFSKNNYKRIYEFEHKKQYMNELFEMIFN